MKSDLAIYIRDCLKEVDKINIDWRVIQKYADDWEDKNIGKIERWEYERNYKTTFKRYRNDFEE